MLNSMQNLERESLWSRKRTAWHRDAASSRLRETVGWLPLFLVALALLSLFVGVKNRDSLLGWTALAAAPACLLLVWGMLTGRGWARLVAGGLALLLAVTNAAGLVVQFARGEQPGVLSIVWICLLSVAWASLGVGLLSREGRERFYAVKPD